MTERDRARRRFFAFLFVSLTLSMSLTGCGEGKKAETEGQKPQASVPNQAPAYGDTVVEGSIGEATNLIPMLASDSASHNISGLIINGLVKYDKDVKLVGDLAESWEVSQGGLQITFKLRRGVTWHDGHPFTAKDVLFGFQTITDP
ncbi:MAG: ABC transporter substrate-binding protein, partial [Candidatus Binatota bacterium]